MILAITQKMVDQYRLTTIMITHQMSHALAMGNRTLLMQEGKVMRDLTGDHVTR